MHADTIQEKNLTHTK